MKKQTQQSSCKASPSLAGSPRYEPCGPEWAAEVMKNRKSAIVGMLRDAIMRPESIPFNVNHDVRVRLHDEGKRIYQDMWGTAPRVDAQGWTRFQMWGFMSLFGPHLLPTMSPPFDPRIELLPENAEMRDRHLEQTPPEKGNVQNEN